MPRLGSPRLIIGHSLPLPPAGLAVLNALPAPAATAALLDVCAAPHWAATVAARRPYASMEDLRAAAAAAWAESTPADRRAALEAHPRIGGCRKGVGGGPGPGKGGPPAAVALAATVESSHASGSAVAAETPPAQGVRFAAWSREEQEAVVGIPMGRAADTIDNSDDTAAVAAASAVAADLDAAIDAYVARFGYGYLVCAAGRSAAELLADVRSRMAHSPAVEANVAAAEEAKITALRLVRLVDALADGGVGAAAPS
ncbi:hypothetical protein MMPV_000194 [Pyropia vietnamensis]